MGLIGVMELITKGGRKNCKPGTNLEMTGGAKLWKERAIVRGRRNLWAVAPPLVKMEKEGNELLGMVRRGIDALMEKFKRKSGLTKRVTRVTLFSKVMREGKRWEG